MKKHRLGLGTGSQTKKKLINELVGHTWHGKKDPLVKYVKRARGGVIPAMPKMSPRRGGAEMVAVKMTGKPKRASNMGVSTLMKTAMKDMSAMMGMKGKRKGLYGGGLANGMPNMAGLQQGMQQLRQQFSPAFPTSPAPMGDAFAPRKRGGKVCKKPRSRHAMGDVPSSNRRQMSREEHSWGDVIGNTLGGAGAGALMGGPLGALAGGVGSFIPGALGKVFGWQDGGPVRVKRAMGGVAKIRRGQYARKK